MLINKSTILVNKPVKLQNSTIKIVRTGKNIRGGGEMPRMHMQYLSTEVGPIG